MPEPFAHAIAPADHHKAADYAVARTRLGRIDTVIDAIVLLALTLGGGIEAIDRLWQTHGPRRTLAWGPGDPERACWSSA